MMQCPVELPIRITQHFGEREWYYKKYGMKGHNGIDFTGGKAGESVPVYAPYDGKITAGYNSGYGYHVRIEAAKNHLGISRQIILAHLKSMYVGSGYITQGDPVGMMGNTGDSSGLHLHCGLRYLDKNGTVINYNNGYFGYVDFEPYLLYFMDKDTAKDFISYPFDK